MDDFSTDATTQLITDYDDFRVTIVNSTKDIPGKKEALKSGIESSNHDWIAVTDADCIGNFQWLKRMMDEAQGKSIVLGYAPLFPGSKLISIFASFEAWLTGVQYLSYAIWGMPYMGVGRNMVYSKSLYLDQNDREKLDELPSGDDDLLINSVATSTNTGIQIEPESFVYSESPNNLRQFILQKSRQHKTSFHYKLNHKLLLTLFSGTHILTYLLLIIAFILELEFRQQLLQIFLLTLFLKYMLSLNAILKLQSPFLKIFYPLMDALLFLFYMVMTPVLFIKNSSKWK